MIYGLIVIYNKACKDSNSVKDFQKYNPNTTLIIYDNSTKDFHNKEYCENNGFIYFTKNRNVGISKAYNYVIDNMHFKVDDYLIILDDDTHITREYFNEVKAAVKNCKYDVILPIVRANNKIISPYNFYMNCRSKMIKNRHDLIKSKISGINSGMVINTQLFNKIKYNENLFLDYVDYDFMRRVHKINGVIHVLNSQIDQEFQYFSYDRKNINGAIFRFKIDLHDYKVLCKETGEVWFFYIHAIKFTLKQLIRYRSGKFIGAFFESII